MNIRPARSSLSGRHFRSAALSFLLLVSFCSALTAQAEKTTPPEPKTEDKTTLRFTAEPCFGNTIRAGWMPLVVTVDNPTRREIAGELVVSYEWYYVPRGAGRDSPVMPLTRMQLTCAPGTAKRFFLYFCGEHLPSWFIQQLPVRVEFFETSQGEPKFRRDLTFAATHGLNIVALSRLRPVRGFLSTVAYDQWGGASQSARQVVYGLPQTLPDRWIGYEQADVVVVSADFPFEESTPEQKAALIEWVKLGGTIVVSPGADTGRLGLQPIATLLDGRRVDLL